MHIFNVKYIFRQLSFLETDFRALVSKRLTTGKSLVCPLLYLRDLDEFFFKLSYIICEILLVVLELTSFFPMGYWGKVKYSLICNNNNNAEAQDYVGILRKTTMRVIFVVFFNLFFHLQMNASVHTSGKSTTKQKTFSSSFSCCSLKKYIIKYNPKI